MLEVNNFTCCIDFKFFVKNTLSLFKEIVFLGARNEPETIVIWKYFAWFYWKGILLYWAEMRWKHVTRLEIMLLIAVALYITILFSCPIFRHSRVLVSGIQRLLSAQHYVSMACFAREVCPRFPLAQCGNDETTVNKLHCRISSLCKTASFLTIATGNLEKPSLCTSKAVFLGTISAPLATVFRGPSKQNIVGN